MLPPTMESLRFLEEGDKSLVSSSFLEIAGRCDTVVANLEACWDRDGLASPSGPAGKIHVRTEPVGSRSSTDAECKYCFLQLITMLLIMGLMVGVP